jgi:hypothetical protein
LKVGDGRRRGLRSTDERRTFFSPAKSAFVENLGNKNEKFPKILQENFFGKFWKKPLALFSSWGIFLPVAGDDRDANHRRPLSSGKLKAKTKIKNFEKSS